MTTDDVEDVDLRSLPDRVGALQSGVSCATVFEIDCERSAAALPELAAVLDADERASVERIRQPLQRQRAAMTRGALRCVLGAYLRVPPERVPLTREPNGRPRLHAAASELGLRISSASCKALGTFVVAGGLEVGIDVEHVDERRFSAATAEHMLHPREMTLFEALPAEARVAWLTSAWVCKEALLKALGVGLDIDPRELEVMSSERPANPLGGRFRPRGLAPWRGLLRRRGAVLTAAVFADHVERVRTLRLVW